MKNFLISLMAISCIALSAGSGPSALAANSAATLKNLKGCFEVTYRFVEDGAHDYDLRGGFYEWIELREENGVMMFQHFGVHDGEGAKHWREDWSPSGENWNQKVIGPFGDFRYE